MGNPNNDPRAMCMRSTDENFYLAVNKPYSEKQLGYKTLKSLTSMTTVHQLNEGSQVFVYPRSEFNTSDPEHPQTFVDSDLFSEEVIMIAQSLRNIAIEPDVHSVKAKIAPDPLEFVVLP